MPGNQPLYSELQKAGYVLVFKSTIPDGDGNVKGNIDADLVLQAMIDFPNYTIVITTDVLKAVYTAHMASSLKNLMSGDQMYHVGKMTQNNIKGMMKVLRNKLKIPSIIVQDTYRKEYYYQFMFMSAPEKISGTTLDSFVKANNIVKKY